MIFRFLRIQKTIRETFETVQDPTNVWKIISGMVLKTLTLIMIITIIVTVALLVFAFFYDLTVLWVFFGIGAAIAITLFIIRTLIAMLIKRMIRRVYREFQRFTHHG